MRGTLTYKKYIKFEITIKISSFVTYISNVNCLCMLGYQEDPGSTSGFSIVLNGAIIYKQIIMSRFY